MSNLSNWNVLHNLESEFLIKIKFICVFDDDRNEVLIVLKDDNVFAFGANKSGLLGLGHRNAIEEPKKVTELCDKQIINISHGNHHCIALTKTGKCYSWGYNDYGQLGNGCTYNNFKPELLSALVDERIADISCGSYHSILLTISGEVYGFGRNQYGQIGCRDCQNQFNPVKINGFNNEIVTSISCGNFHSLALTESGHVYSWGYNSEGELGLGHNIHQCDPRLIRGNLSEVFIKKIVCGPYHSLLLSSSGQIYSFGHNPFGQLGTGNQTNQNIPTKIITSNKFIDIASSINNDISVAKSENDFCYVWGQCCGGEITTPKGTAFDSIDDVFFVYAINKTTYKPLSFGVKQKIGPILKKLEESFNNPEFSDFSFKIDDKLIYAHKAILKISCEHFRSMFSENWDKNDTKQVEIDFYSYPVYYSFLKYIYTNTVDIEVKDVMELYDLANSYFEEDLKKECIQIIKNKISVTNAFTLYTNAVKYNSEELEEFCLRFAADNLNDVCITDSFNKLEPQLCKRFLERAAKLRVFK